MRMYIKTGKISNCSGALVAQRAAKWTTITSTTLCCIGTGSHACIEIANRATLSSLSIWLAAWNCGQKILQHGGHTPVNTKSCSLRVYGIHL